MLNFFISHKTLFVFWYKYKRTLSLHKQNRIQFLIVICINMRVQPP